ncbi:MAG: SH3 domain-containing protein [Chitinispirillaceae bacterium]|nr:SH3 domain-containing protein [Chitinispirillaceae bacterium]
MRFITLSCMMALFTVLCVSSQVHATSYLLVEEPLAKIYKELDPKSPIIKQVKKGEYLELIYDGTSWHKVKVDGQEGWIERRAGKIVDKKGGVPVGSIVLLLIVAFGTLGAAFYYISKNRTPSLAQVDDTL